MRCAIRPALTEPLNLIFLVLSIAAGLAAGWWFFLLGLALYGGLVYLTARDPIVHVRECLRRRAPPAPRLEPPFGQIERAQARLSSALTHTAPQVRRTLRPVQRAFAEAVGAAYRLGRGATALEGGGRKTAALGRPGLEQGTPGTGICAASDDEEMPLMSARLERAAALLSSLGSELEGMLAKVARRPQVEACVPAWVQTLRQQRQQLDGFAEQLEER
jgi:hypothetical protein